MSTERTVETKYIYQGKLVALRVDTVELASGRHAKREIVEHDACCAIVAIDDEENVLFVSQYRKPVEKVLLEIPAGGIEENEEPLECARRELAEETGFSARRWEKLGSFYTSPGFCTEEMHVYIARELSPAKRACDIDEDIKIVCIPLVNIPDLIAGDGVSDAKSIAGLMMALLLIGKDWEVTGNKK